MTPNSTELEKVVRQNKTQKIECKTKIVWMNVIFYIYLHASFIYALYLIVKSASWKTTLFAYIYGNLGLLGLMAGTHRLWSHRSYKAKWPLRVLLCCLDSIAGQNDIYTWCRDHRVHHKFAETDADPHNIHRGFFFAHIGWLLCKKHPDVLKKGKTVPLNDLMDDPIVRFQKRFYIWLYSFFCFILPTVIPFWFWDESMWNSFFVAALGKYCFSLHLTWTVNSVSHKYGYQPYDKNIKSTENVYVSLLTTGEGFHNYHHVFPWDYSSSEFGCNFNLSKLFIELMAVIGQAYDLKVAKPKMVQSRKIKTGDSTREN